MSTFGQMASDGDGLRQTVYCQCAVELTRAAAISVIYRMVGGGDFFRPVTVMWRFCTNNKVSQGAAGDFLTFLLFYFEFFTLKTSISKYILKSKILKIFASGDDSQFSKISKIRRKK